MDKAEGGRYRKLVVKAIITEISELVVVAGKATSNRVRSVHRLLSLGVISVDDRAPDHENKIPWGEERNHIVFEVPDLFGLKRANFETLVYRIKADLQLVEALRHPVRHVLASIAAPSSRSPLNSCMTADSLVARWSPGSSSSSPEE